MMFHDVKTAIKKHDGFNAFYTTPLKTKNTKNISVLSSVKPFICIPEHSQANKPTNYGFIPYISIFCYNNAITYFKRSSVKCI